MKYGFFLFFVIVLTTMNNGKKIDEVTNLSIKNKLQREHIPMSISNIAQRTLTPQISMKYIPHMLKNQKVKK
jgi:hypothetical protein